jgi:GT2 family glycosyltransferase
MGFAPANNIGIALATGEYIMTLNNDTEMEPACVSEMTRTLAASPASWACAPKIVSFDAPPMIVNAGIGVRDHMPTDRGGGEPDDGRYDTPEEVFGPNGGAGLYKKKVLDEIGLYDEDFFFYYEDVDLAWRARLAGWTCVYAPAAICRHESGGTSKALPFFTEYHIFRNLIWLYLKNIPAPYFRKKLPGLIWQEIIFWKAQITRRESRWIRMKLDAYRKIPRMLMKRRHVQKMRRISNGELERWIVPMLPS